MFLRLQRPVEHDAENKMTEHYSRPSCVGMVCSDSTSTAFEYDGNGRRVQIYGATFMSTFVYGADGSLVYEWGGGKEGNGKDHAYLNGELLVTADSENVRWLVKDQLGTPRIVMDKYGDIICHDYLPFGEEIPSNIAGRSTQGYSYPQSDGVRQQFTGYERDVDTGLDFAQARYYASAQGRFTSTDPLMASALPGDPQTFNRYAYVRNSPLVMIDPTGMFGDYFTRSGKYLGNDGKDNGKIYFATAVREDASYSYIALNSIQRTTLSAVLSAQDRAVALTPGPANGVSDLIQATAAALDQKIPVVAGVAGAGVLVGSGAGLAMAASGTVATVTTLGLAEAGTGAATTLGAAAAANPDRAAQVGIQFGRVANQVYHAFRHTDRLGLSRNAVEAGVRADLQKVSIPSGPAVARTIEVAGQRIIYNAYRLPDGTINVGRITGP